MSVIAAVSPIDAGFSLWRIGVIETDACSFCVTALIFPGGGSVSGLVASPGNNLPGGLLYHGRIVLPSDGEINLQENSICS